MVETCRLERDERREGDSKRQRKDMESLERERETERSERFHKGVTPAVSVADEICRELSEASHINQSVARRWTWT